MASSANYINGTVASATSDLLCRLEAVGSCDSTLRKANISPKGPSEQPDIALIHDNMSYHDDVSDIRLLDDEETLSVRSQNRQSRNYIPSPLTTPRRMTRKLGDQITNSPIFRRKLIASSAAPPPAPSSLPSTDPIASSQRTAAASENKSGLLAFLSSAFKRTNGRKNFDGKNMFLDPRMHDDYEDSMEMHQFSDSGRIANRYDNMRWDVWTTMGENVLEYNGVLLDEGEVDPYYDEECSSSEDEFLEIPLNDKFFYKH